VAQEVPWGAIKILKGLKIVTLFSCIVCIRVSRCEFVHWPIADLRGKFHANPFASFCAKLLYRTNRQTYKQTNNDENITSLAEVKKPLPMVSRCWWNKDEKNR